MLTTFSIVSEAGIVKNVFKRRDNELKNMSCMYSLSYKALKGDVEVESHTIALLSKYNIWFTTFNEWLGFHRLESSSFRLSKIQSFLFITFDIEKLYNFFLFYNVNSEEKIIFSLISIAVRNCQAKFWT